MVTASILVNKPHRIEQVKFGRSFFLIVGIIGSLLYAIIAFSQGEIGRLFNDIPALIGYSSLATWLYLLRIKPINEFFLFTGKISYSFYLLHLLFMHLALFIFDGWSVILVLALTLLIIYIAVSYTHLTLPTICSV